MSGYVGKDPYTPLALTKQQLEEMEAMKRQHRPGPRNRHEKRAAEAKMNKRMKARAKTIGTAIRTGKAK
jgi:hypothetical protein